MVQSIQRNAIMALGLWPAGCGPRQAISEYDKNCFITESFCDTIYGYG